MTLTLIGFGMMALVSCSEAPESALQDTVANTAAASVSNAAAHPEKGEGDYFAADVATRRAQLVTEVRAKATDVATLKTRAATLWVWANAVAMKGIPISPVLTETLGRIAALRTPLQPSPELTQAAQQLDLWVEELSAREKNPKMIGSLTSPNTGPFPVASRQTLEQVYTVGDAPIEVGGGIFITSEVIPFQARDANGEAYASADASNGSVSLVVTEIPFVSPLDPAATKNVPFFRVTGGALKKGNSITLRLGERSGAAAAESMGVKMPNTAMANLGVRVWVRLKADGPIFPLQQIAFRTEGLETAAVRAYGPSIVGVGEPARISVRSEDQYRNRATAAFPKYKLAANGAELGEITNQNVAINHLTTSFAAAGVYRVTVTSDDGFVVGESNPILVQEDPSQRIYWGETRGRAGLATDVDSVDAYFKFAREDAQLSFAALSEEDRALNDAAWERMRKATLKQRKPGEFETFLANTWTGSQGARLVLFRAPDNRRRVDVHRAPSLSDLYSTLDKEAKSGDFLMIATASETPITAMDAKYAPIAEIVSNRGTFEWFGQRVLGSGLRVGFAGASNGRFGQPGLRAFDNSFAAEVQDGQTAVLAETGDRDALFDGLRSGATYVTNGHRMVIDVALNGRTLGHIAPRVPQQEFSGRIIGTAAVEQIQVFKNGTLVQTNDFSAAGAGGNTLEVRFFSPSGNDQFEARRWQGYLTVEGARLLAVHSDVDHNTLTEKVQQNEANPARVDFTVSTHGYSRSLRLQLDGLNTALQLALSFDGDAASRSVSLAQMEEGGVIAFEDRGALVQVRPVQPATENDQFFSYVDSAAKPGDAYFVRATTADGGMGWSSPIWVGGATESAVAVAAPP